MDRNMCVVGNWLQSLGLVQYTQAFIDNGYDDLEICKQIGQEDLDAIGVMKQAHREDILDAVSVLLKYGGTRVYFVLDPDYQGGLNANPPNPPCTYARQNFAGNYYSSLSAENIKLMKTNYNGASFNRITNGFPCRVPLEHHAALMDGSDRTTMKHSQSLLLHGMSKPRTTTTLPQPQSLPPYSTVPSPSSSSKTTVNCNPEGIPFRWPRITHPHSNQHQVPCTRRSLVTFPKLQLTAVIQGKLSKDGIHDLAADPGHRYYTKGRNSLSEHQLEKLAKKYAEELHTHHQDVFQVLLDLKRIMSSNNCDTPSPMEDREWLQNSFSLFSVNGQCHRSIPPPLPPRPPPSNIYEDPLDLDPSLKASPAHSSRSPLLPQQRLEEMSECQANEEETIMKRRSLTLGRLLRGGFKKQPKKYVYKQYKGDLSASEITMPDEERIELMIRVKEGKLSMHDAVERVKQYETEKKQSTLQTPLPNGNGHI